MLKGHAHSFRSRSRLAIGLSWVAGYTNVITLIAAGQTVSHQTGNATHVGADLGRALTGNAAAATGAAYFAALVGCFGVGAFASGLMTEAARRTGRRSRFVLPLTVEAILLAGVTVLLRHHPGVAALIAAAAMGLQNATITRISGAVVRTTHLTGVTTDLGLELAAMATALTARGGHRWRHAVRHPATRRAALLAAIFVSFSTGAALGSVAHAAAGAAALLVPVGFLTALVARERLSAVAEVRPLPTPPEWADLLPPTVGLFRLAHPRPGRRDHPPDFAAWAERLPPQWRVVILAVDPLTGFHADAAMGLLSAGGLLGANGRTLIVAGLGRAQLQLLRHCDPHHRIKWSDFPPDLEFAVARALSLSEPANSSPDHG